MQILERKIINKLCPATCREMFLFYTNNDLLSFSYFSTI